MGHAKVYNNDIEFVPAHRELAVTKGKSLGRASPKSVCLLKTRTSAVAEQKAHSVFWETECSS